MFTSYSRLTWLSVLLCIGTTTLGAGPLPPESGPPALQTPHMPDRLHAFVWRNWGLVGAEQMAKVVGTNAENIRKIGLSLGLPEVTASNDLMRQRGYVTLIRRNWHLLPFEQLLKLLDWTPEQLAYTLREDDFLWAKLGMLKPTCTPLRYEPPTETAEKRAGEIAALVREQFGTELSAPAQPRFQFVEDLSKPAEGVAVPASRPADEPIRFLYSYFALYGDPLLQPELDPYPDGLLQKLAASGVNGVWLHTVLRQLAPSSVFPEFGQDHEKRIENLRKLVARAGKYGIRIYLYTNEPRAMPPAFFERHPEVRGVTEGEYITMCTSTPEVRRWLTESYEYVFRNVPELGGVFTITASENLTNCFSHGGQAKCPRCSKRSWPEVIGEVNAALAEGVWRGSPRAKVIAWDWGWPEAAAEAIIRALPQNVYLMSVSEWDLPIKRGGVAGTVGEYSISSVGPGPRATRHWAIARERGLKTLAKVQVNCTWELSAVPYLPAMNLVARHCAGLTKSGVDGLMLSWTLGGYPSPNLSLVQQFFSEGAPPQPADALARVAKARFGDAAAPGVQQAWTQFSAAFEEFPFHIAMLYNGPMQVGPANPLYLEPSGYHATMVGFPYDDLNTWRAIYPPEVVLRQFEKVAAGWQSGLETLRKAAELTSDPAQKAHAADDIRIAEAAGLHFRSAANQVRFIIARNALKTPPEKERASHLADMRAAAEDEMRVARRLFTLTREDARIGYEASNHYYYVPLDLVEKVVNCEDVLNRMQ